MFEHGWGAEFLGPHRHADPDDFKSMTTHELLGFLYIEAPEYGTTPAAAEMLYMIAINELKRRPMSVTLYTDAGAFF